MSIAFYKRVSSVSKKINYNNVNKRKGLQKNFCNFKDRVILFYILQFQMSLTHFNYSTNNFRLYIGVPISNNIT